MVNVFSQTVTDKVIAACMNGLHSLTALGEHMYRIGDSHFMDVSLFSGCLMAIELQKYQVHVFKPSEGRWTLHTVLTLPQPSEVTPHSTIIHKIVLANLTKQTTK